MLLDYGHERIVQRARGPHLEVREVALFAEIELRHAGGDTVVLDQHRHHVPHGLAAHHRVPEDAPLRRRLVTTDPEPDPGQRTESACVLDQRDDLVVALEGIAVLELLERESGALDQLASVHPLARSLVGEERRVVHGH